MGASRWAEFDARLWVAVGTLLVWAITVWIFTGVLYANLLWIAAVLASFGLGYALAKVPQLPARERRWRGRR